MQIPENISLLPYNSFHMDVRAKHFARFSDTDQLADLLSVFRQSPIPQQKLMILGGGSNILLTRDFEGWVLKNEVMGIEELHEDTDYVYVRAGAGEDWHSFVQYCIGKGWAGLENLSLIPGNVGASPMQNIGAYGVELRDVFWDLEAYHLQDQAVHTFTEVDCAFGYRESVFKNKFRDQFVILNVTFRLRKKPVFHTSYGAIQQELDRMGVRELSIEAISQAVIRIRQSKLPDPKILGNAGSFFKNPMITLDRYEELRELFPDIAGFVLTDNRVKIAAGWLIEKCGWKGYRKGDAGCYEKQALVLVNYGKATGEDILQLADEIAESVAFKFAIQLEKEVNII